MLITHCLLQGPSVIHPRETRPSFTSSLLDSDMALCADLRSKGVFLHASNRLDWGHLVNADDFPTEHTHNELWELERNRWDWEKRYAPYFLKCTHKKVKTK